MITLGKLSVRDNDKFSGGYQPSTGTPCQARLEVEMSKHEFRAFLDLLMCSDPWPVSDGCGANEKILINFANEESIKQGHIDWIDAYHRFIA